MRSPDASAWRARSAEVPRRGVLEEGLGAGAVQLEALGGEQVVGDRLGEEGVPELVAALPPRLEDVVLDGGPEGGTEGGRVDAGDALEEHVRHPAADDGRDAHHALGVLVELVDPGEEETGEVTGVHAAATGRGGELLGEEGVALRAAGDLLDDPRGQVGAGPAHDAAQVGVGQGAELEPGEGGQARPHGQGPGERVPAVDVVAAVGREEADAVGAPAGEEEGQQLAGRLVGPVDVLDDDEHGSAAAEVGEGAVDRLDEVGAHGIPAGAAGQPRHERDEPGVGGDEVVDEVALPGVEPRDHLDEGQVRQAGADLPDAVADEDPPVGGPGDEPVDEGGLADAGVTAEQHGPAAAVVPAEGVGDAVELLVATDEVGVGTGRHGPDHGTRHGTGHGWRGRPAAATVGRVGRSACSARSTSRRTAPGSGARATACSAAGRRRRRARGGGRSRPGGTSGLRGGSR